MWIKAVHASLGKRASCLSHCKKFLPPPFHLHLKRLQQVNAHSAKRQSDPLLSRDNKNPEPPPPPVYTRHTVVTPLNPSEPWVLHGPARQRRRRRDSIRPSRLRRAPPKNTLGNKFRPALRVKERPRPWMCRCMQIDILTSLMPVWRRLPTNTRRHRSFLLTDLDVFLIRLTRSFSFKTFLSKR